MTKEEFINKVQIGTTIVLKNGKYICTDILDRFMYSFDVANADSKGSMFSLIGITDGIVKDIELGE